MYVYGHLYRAVQEPQEDTNSWSIGQCIRLVMRRVWVDSYFETVTLPEPGATPSLSVLSIYAWLLGSGAK